MDITVDVGGQLLNVRTATCIIHNNKLLTHRNVNSDHYALPGGRVEIGEDSESALKREVMEEMGKEIEITGYVTTIENFFEMKGKKYHEIEFVHMAEFTNEEDKKIEETIHNIEGKDFLQYEWVDINEIDKYPILPQAIKGVLKNGIYPTHTINDDLKGV